jgi:hypothetical protein
MMTTMSWFDVVRASLRSAMTTLQRLTSKGTDSDLT